jgi:hypothetical protein
MPGFQGCPFLFGQVGADNGFSIDNCLQGHNDPICFLSIKSCLEILPGSQTIYIRKKSVPDSPPPLSTSLKTPIFIIRKPPDPVTPQPPLPQAFPLRLIHEECTIDLCQLGIIEYML